MLPRRAARPISRPVIDGEHHVGERRQDAADEEDLADRAVEAAGLGDLQAEVLDVLGEREPARDGRRVDDAVDRAVEEAAPDDEDQQHAEALGELLDDRRLEDGLGEDRAVGGTATRRRSARRRR